jgi:hypothetical protein
LPRLYAFIDAWKTAPPLPEAVASFVGIKPAPPQPGLAPHSGAKPGLPQMLSDVPTIVLERPL